MENQHRSKIEEVPMGIRRAWSEKKNNDKFGKRIGLKKLNICKSQRDGIRWSDD